MKSKFLKKLQTADKKTAIVYITLRALIILTLIESIYRQEAFSAFMCGVALVLFTIPNLLRSTFKIALPGLLEITVYCFIFATAILGEIHNFYNVIPFWDTILHTLNGFVCAGIGVSLIDLLNENSHRMFLSPIYVTIVSFCFSMTVGVCWEFIEHGADLLLLTDMQKDTKVTVISSVDLNPSGENSPVILKDIEKTEITYDDGKTYVYEGGYLDIGLYDTMKDMFVNMIGAIVYSVLGYFYLVHRGKKKSITTQFIPTKVTEDSK